MESLVLEVLVPSSAPTDKAYELVRSTYALAKKVHEKTGVDVVVKTREVAGGFPMPMFPHQFHGHLMEGLAAPVVNIVAEGEESSDGVEEAISIIIKTLEESGMALVGMSGVGVAEAEL